MGIFDKFKDVFTEKGEAYPAEFNEDYVELEANKDLREKAKVTVRPFIITDFADIKPMLDSLREGYTIALVNVGPLKEKDMVELKRAVNKLKKTCDAIEGDIAGFGENWLVITPSFAKIWRDNQTENIVEQ
ncbi:MAG TPA: cell division protein SepF [Candidatus Nanoarchaeia archaeon]|nr:cell division protein SepF [Candidatus Nanoarchaeia archaeon]